MRKSLSALLVVLCCTAAAPALASAANTATIHGTAESATGPIANMPVCEDSLTEYFPGCTVTNSKGEYTLSELPAGEYVLEFTGEVCTTESGCSPEACKEDQISCTRPYVPQFYREQPTYSMAEEHSRLSLAEGESIEASEKLSAGGKIEGTVTLAALGKPTIAGVDVCAQSESGDVIGQCAKTKADGQYAIEGLPTSEYQVKAGGEECTEYNGCSMTYLAQYYGSKALPSEAEFLSLEAPGARTGVDMSLVEISQKQPASLSGPMLSGTPSVGATLACSEGTWSNNPTAIAYAWLRNGVAIAHQSGSSYTVTKEDAGASLTCEATVGNQAGLASAVSNALMVPAPAPAPSGTTTTPPASTPEAKVTPEAKAGVAVANAKASAVRTAMVTLKCSATGACKGTLELVYQKKLASGKQGKTKVKNVTIGTASFTIAAGGKETIAVQLTATGATDVAKSGKRGLKLKLKGSGVQARTLLVRLSSN